MKQLLFPALLGICLLSCKRKDVAEPQCPLGGRPLMDTSRVGYRFVMPNAFTPNSDGLNDVFRLVKEDDSVLPSYELQITDADDNILYTIFRTRPEWDGINPATGKPYPPGVYGVTFGFIQPAEGLPGLSIAADGFTCISILDPDPRVRPIRELRKSDYVFESQVDPATMKVGSESGEKFSW